MREISNSKIACVGVPTFERPGSLYRCLKTHLDNISAYRDEVDICVADDSVQQHYQQANIEMIKTLEKEFEMQITYWKRAQRQEQADQISNYTDCPLHVSRFALLGHPECSSSFGSARNSLLLRAAGSMMLQIDDDTICTLFKSSEFQSGVSFNTSGDPNQYYFYKEEPRSVVTSNSIQTNLLALHESLLGTKTVL